MTSQERNARDYCHSIGADPDALVRGYDFKTYGHRGVMVQLRWRWYVNAVVTQKEAAE